MKRDPIKYIRDICKSAYKKGDECFICSTKEKLEFHHFYSMTLLWNKWCTEKKISIEIEEDILENREQFKEDHKHEIYNETVTLCTICHNQKLHKIYGKCPSLGTAQKQKRWCQKQRDKHNLQIITSEETLKRGNRFSVK